MKKQLFFQKCGTYQGEILVAVGYKNYDELIKELKELNPKGSIWIKALIAAKDDEPHHTEEKATTYHYIKWEYDKHSFQMIFLMDWKKDFEHINILAHEIVHAASIYLSELLNPGRENEALAYQHTFLMRELYPRLNRNLSLPDPLLKKNKKNKKCQKKN